MKKKIVIFSKLNISLKNYNLINLTNPILAIETLHIENPDLIILDIKQKLINGFDLVRLFKKDIRYKKVKFILISDFYSEDFAVKAFESGTDEYIVYPFYIKEFEKRVDKLLQNKDESINYFECEDFYIKRRTVKENNKEEYRQKNILFDKITKQEIILGNTEYRFLALLMNNRPRVIDHITIAKEAGAAETVNAVTMLVKTLRKKHPCLKTRIVANSKKGYRFE